MRYPECTASSTRLFSNSSALRRYLFNDAEVKSFDSAQLASECFGGEMTVESRRKVGLDPVSPLTDTTFIFQTKTYDSVTDKFMDFSFEKVRMTSDCCLICQDWEVIDQLCSVSVDAQCLHALL